MCDNTCVHCILPALYIEYTANLNVKSSPRQIQSTFALWCNSALIVWHSAIVYMCCLSATQPRSLRFVNFKTWVSKLSLKNLLILSYGSNILEYHYKCNIYTVKTKIQNTCKRPSSDLAIVIHRVFESWVVIAFSSSSTVPGIELIVILGQNHDFMEFIADHDHNYIMEFQL